MITSHRTTEALQRQKGKSIDAGELLAKRGEVKSTRKQVNDAYARICAGEVGLQKRNFRKFVFGKRDN